MKSFQMNSTKVSKGTRREIKPQYKKAADQTSLESTVKKYAKLLKWDEYLLADNNKPLRGKLQCYYKGLFPFKEMCAWLCYGESDLLHCREFSYVQLPKRFRRYKTFDSFSEMKFEICKVCPVKIDIGAIFNVRPFMEFKTRKMIAHPVERELVFDIDLSDYNNIRSCCKAENICQKCWKFAAVAVKIMHTSFVEDFGWKHILWVFSGRRGIHCWVCDPDARRLSSEQRQQIINYYKLEKPGLIYRNDNDNDGDDDGDNDEDNDADEEYDFEAKRLDPLERHHMGRSYIFAKRDFVQICLNEQEILRTPEGVEQFTSLLPTLPCRKKVTQLLVEGSTSLEKWTEFEKYWKSKDEYPTYLRKLRPHLIKHIILWYLYPRIDVAVSTGMNHLLKAPFSFHPTTLLVCTPFDPHEVDRFNISEVPHLERLHNFAKLRRHSSTATSAERIHVERFADSRLVFHDFLENANLI